MSDSLRPHVLHHSRPPCPSPTHGVHPNPCLLSQWCPPIISSSVVPFSSHPQSFPASGSFQMIVTHSCPTLCNLMDSPSFSVHGILQARILEWIAIPFARGSSWLKDQTQTSCIASSFLTIWATQIRNYYISNFSANLYHMCEQQWRWGKNKDILHTSKLCFVRDFCMIEVSYKQGNTWKSTIPIILESSINSLYLKDF